MKKKYVAAMLSLMAALSFSACGQEKITEEPAAVETPEVTEGEASFAQDPAAEKAETSEVEDAMNENMIADEQEAGEVTASETEGSVQDQIVGLPDYKSPESGSIEEAITLYLWDQMGFKTPAQEGGVNIPAYVILKSVATEDDFTKVYGDFWVYGYTLDGTNLVCENGGSYPGVFYLRQNENGYEAASFEMLEDGSGYTESLEAVCEGDEELKQKFLDASDAANPECINARIGFIRWYANANGLKIDTYQDFGQDPVSLSETIPVPEDTNEEAE